MDILNTPDGEVLFRCVFTSVSSGKIQCEIIEKLNDTQPEKDSRIFCVFAPVKTDIGKINSFSSLVIRIDASGKRTDRIVLSPPNDYTLMTRRKHTRKRVADQQFIRVKLWIADPYTSDIHFEDAAPHIGVNSFSDDGPNQSANAVVNISHGGIGLTIKNTLMPETSCVGSQTALNIFMFNFAEKTFKPYWYSGEIRTIEQSRPGFVRIGIEFNGTGTSGQDGNTIKWRHI